MPRPVQYSKEDMESLIQDKLEKGIPVKANCAQRHWPYVSVNKALRRYGLSIPKRYAEVKARVAGKPQVVPVATKAKKTRQRKKKAPTPVQSVVGGSQSPA